LKKLGAIKNGDEEDPTVKGGQQFELPKLDE
jgi:hypothetical protein